MCRSYGEEGVLILYPKKPSRVIVMVGNTIFGALSGVRKVSWGLVIQEVIGKLVSALEKRKPSSISPYLFHFYHRNKCLRMEEMDILEAAKYCLQYGVSPEAKVQPDVVEIDLKRELLSSMKQRKILGVSPGSRKKQTYQLLDGKSPV